jgi:ribosomal RNA-processing protein 7
MPSSSTPSSPPLIKGYLPVRIRFPTPTDRQASSSASSTDDSFIFLREHRNKQSEPSSSQVTDPSLKSKQGTTLFVANAPIYPGISTKILLKSIFGRFAEVTRVTVVQNPRTAVMAGKDSSQNSSLSAWSENTDFFHPTFLPPILSSNEGKYAHVVFSSPKEMKKAKKALEDLMISSISQNGSNKGKKKNKNPAENGVVEHGQLAPALEFDNIELQTLSDESLRQWEERRRNVLHDSQERDQDNTNEDIRQSEYEKQDAFGRNAVPQKQVGVLAVARRYRESCKLLSRSRLLEECNAVMQAYEAAEEAKRRAQEAARSQPDDDGFVTVSYSSAVGSKEELEESMTATTPSRRKGNKRSRKKKQAVGSQELPDFYRFQRKETRKRTMEELRKQFDEDLKKVKRRKDEKQYRPF